MEVFGENPFEPEDKKEALHLDEKQQKLSVKYGTPLLRDIWLKQYMNKAAA